MRELTVAFTRRGTTLTFVCAAVTSVSCDASVRCNPSVRALPAPETRSVGGAAEADRATPVADAGPSGTPPHAGRSPTAAERYPYPRHDCGVGFVVPLPDEGIAPELDSICRAPDGVVASPWAARIELERRGTSTYAGWIAFPGNVPAPVTPPQVTVRSIDNVPSKPRIAVSARPGGGFGVTLTWPSALPVPSVPPARMVLDVQYDEHCAPDRKQTVRAQTVLYLCKGRAGPEWVSSGDACGECSVICEMAPSPAIAACWADDLALAAPMQARVRVVGRAGPALVLLSEHELGADACSYEWRVGSGTLLFAERDVAVWLPGPGTDPQTALVAIDAGRSAAIASLRLEVPA